MVESISTSSGGDALRSSPSAKLHLGGGDGEDFLEAVSIGKDAEASDVEAGGANAEVVNHRFERRATGFLN